MSDFDEIGAPPEGSMDEMLTGEAVEAGLEAMITEEAAQHGIDSFDGTPGKRCLMIDFNLFSGSADRFRNSVGGYYYNISDVSGNIVPNFYPFAREMTELSPWAATHYKKSKNKYIDSVFTFPLSPAYELVGEGDLSGRLIPNKKFVVAVNGDPRKIANDKFWKIIWTGGVFDEIQYDSIFNNDTVFDDYHAAYMHAYPYAYKRSLRNPEAVTNYAQISTKYNEHLRDYQRYASEIEDHRLLPSAHLSAWAYLYSSGATSPSTEYPPRLYNYLSIDGQYDRPALEFLSMSAFLEEKLTVAVPYTEETKNWAKRKFANMLFGNSYYNWDVHAHLQATSSVFPYGATVKMPVETSGKYGNIITNREFGDRFLVTLKEVFNNQSRVPVMTKTFEKNTKYLTSSAKTDGNIYVSDSVQSQARCVDMHEMLLHSYKNIKCEYDDFFVVGRPSLEQNGAGDKTGNYRHLNSSNASEVIKDMTDILYDEMGTQFLGSLYNIRRNSKATVSAVEHYSELHAAPQSRYSEVIAYRIDKIGGPATGDSNTKEVLQTYWFFNSPYSSEIDFFDSQVKYGEEYTYKIYEYRCIQGVKYKYSNLQLSRVIGIPTAGGSANEFYMLDVPADDPDFNPPFYCIEYYDPYNGDTKKDLMSIDRYYGGGGAKFSDHAGLLGGMDETYGGEISSLASGAQRIAKTRTNVSWPAESTRPFFANFLVTTEPRLKIYEIPIMTKTVKIMDNPPNKVCVYPTFIADNSQTLKFKIQYEGFAHRAYPHPITEQDTHAKESYLNNDDMLEDQPILKETISRHRTLEVYRLPYRPKSFDDFSGALINSYDMNMDLGNYSYNDICIYDRIPSSRKFYYAFRVLNDNGVGGYIEEVIEAQFINDGGYKYALFDTIFYEQLAEDTHTKVTKSAKKLLQLAPAATHTSLDVDNADLSKGAIEQFSNGNIKIGTAKDLVWDKTFKVRLTSRKTGKKIDLNITYRYNNDILGTE